MARALGLLIWLTSLWLINAEAKSSTKPNIVYILADDLGWNDVGFHNPKVQTPNINRLHAKGIELTSNYAQTVCSASRAALMTGKYPAHNGMQHLVLAAQGTSCLPLEHKLLPQYMKELGYTTKLVGKWHLGYCHKECLPSQRGFDDFTGLVGGQGDYWTWDDQGVMLKYANNTAETRNLGKTHLTIQDGIDVREKIMAHKGSTDPLFMVLTPNAPHTPLKPTTSMYNVHDFLSHDTKRTSKRRKYLGLVSALDDLVGETMLALADADMSENTIIIFQSDNGGSSIAPLVPGFESYGNNYPLRNGKFSHFEGGVRVPTIYYDPRLERSTRGTKRDFLIHITDWLPTLLELSNSNKIPAGIDGVSQVANLGNDYFSGDRYKVREKMLVNIDTISPFKYVYHCTNRDFAFRYKDWKLIYGRRTTWTFKEKFADEYKKPEESPELPTMVGDSCQRIDHFKIKTRCLFNVKDDPSEQKNLFDSEPAMVDKILAMVDEIKQSMVKAVYTRGIGTTDKTTAKLAKLRIPRNDYCDPETDFPLKPNDVECLHTDPHKYSDEQLDIEETSIASTVGEEHSLTLS